MDTRFQEGIIGFLLFAVGKENQTASFICKWGNSLMCKTVVRSALPFFFFFFFLAWHTCHCNIFLEKNHTLLISFKKKIDVDTHSEVYEPISFKFCKAISSSKEYSLIPFLMTLTIIQGHRKGSQLKQWSFSEYFQSIQTKFGILLKQLHLLKPTFTGTQYDCSLRETTWLYLGVGEEGGGGGTVVTCTWMFMSWFLLNLICSLFPIVYMIKFCFQNINARSERYGSPKTFARVDQLKKMIVNKPGESIVNINCCNICSSCLKPPMVIGQQVQFGILRTLSLSISCVTFKRVQQFI